MEINEPKQISVLAMLTALIGIIGPFYFVVAVGIVNRIADKLVSTRACFLFRLTAPI